MAKDEPVKKIEYNEPQVSSDQAPNFESLQGTIRVVSSVPTWTPRNVEESICIYRSGSTVRWYAYDFDNKSWEKFTNTTLAESGQSALEGDITLSEGQGISLTQASNDIEIATNLQSYFGITQQTQTISAGSPTYDLTITCGFEPKLIILWGWFDESSTPPTQLPRQDLGVPMFWKTGGTYRGVNFKDGTGSEDWSSAALAEANDAVSSAYVLVANTTSTGFDLRMSLITGASSHSYQWDFLYLVFG